MCIVLVMLVQPDLWYYGDYGLISQTMFEYGLDKVGHIFRTPQYWQGTVGEWGQKLLESVPCWVTVKRWCLRGECTRMIKNVLYINLWLIYFHGKLVALRNVMDVMCCGSRVCAPLCPGHRWDAQILPIFHWTSLLSEFKNIEESRSILMFHDASCFQ